VSEREKRIEGVEFVEFGIGELSSAQLVVHLSH